MRQEAKRFPEKISNPYTKRNKIEPFKFNTIAAECRAKTSNVFKSIQNFFEIIEALS